MKNKGIRIFTVLLAVVLCMTAFSTVAFAGGGDESYYTEPTETAEPTTEPEETPTYEPGTPFTEDGNLITRDLLFDKTTNKQYITVETRNGHTFYIVIDYDKPTDEDGEQFYTYFLNMVDEADLLAIIEDENSSSPVTCTCTEKCAPGAVNASCPLCSKDMTNCAGKEATPNEPQETEPPQEEAKTGGAGGMILIVLILALAGGGALWYFKFRKPKTSVKGSTELDEFDFDEDDEDEADGSYSEYSAVEPSDTDKQEDDE